MYTKNICHSLPKNIHSMPCNCLFTCYTRFIFLTFKTKYSILWEYPKNYQHECKSCAYACDYFVIWSTYFCLTKTYEECVSKCM